MCRERVIFLSVQWFQDFGNDVCFLLPTLVWQKKLKRNKSKIQASCRAKIIHVRVAIFHS